MSPRVFIEDETVKLRELLIDVYVPKDTIEETKGSRPPGKMAELPKVRLEAVETVKFSGANTTGPPMVKLD